MNKELTTLIITGLFLTIISIAAQAQQDIGKDKIMHVLAAINL